MPHQYKYLAIHLKVYSRASSGGRRATASTRRAVGGGGLPGTSPAASGHPWARRPLPLHPAKSPHTINISLTARVTRSFSPCPPRLPSTHPSPTSSRGTSGLSIFPGSQPESRRPAQCTPQRHTPQHPRTPLSNIGTPFIPLGAASLPGRCSKTQTLRRAAVT